MNTEPVDSPKRLADPAPAIEYDVLPTCLRHGMGVLTYSPLAGGWLSGRYRKGRRLPSRVRRGADTPTRRQRSPVRRDPRPRKDLVAPGDRGQPRG